MKLPARKVLTPYLNATEHASRFGFNQALTEVEALNQQPPAGGGPEVLAWLADNGEVMDAQDGALFVAKYPGYKPLIDRSAYTALQARLQAAEAERDALREALQANHYWHQEYDDHGGYAGSELEEINVAALTQQVKP